MSPKLFSWVPCTGTWPGMMSLPSESMPLSIGPFPNRFPVGSCPLHGPSISSTNVLLEYLGPSRLPLLPCSFKLPMGPQSCWTFRKWTGRLVRQNRSSTPLYPCFLPTGPDHKVRHTSYSLWRRNFSHNSLLPDFFSFLRGTGPSPSHPLWTVPTSLPRFQSFLVLISMQDKTEGEFFL